MKLPFVMLATVEQQSLSCADRGEMVKVLKERFGEAPRAIGLANQTGVIEVFTSRAGTFTILMTRPDGASCIVSARQNWEENPPVRSMTAL